MPLPRAVKEMRADLFHFLKGHAITDVQFDNESILLVLDNGEAMVINGEVTLGSMNKAKETVGVSNDGFGQHGSHPPA